MYEIMFTAAPFIILTTGIILAILSISWRRSTQAVSLIALITFFLATCSAFGWLTNPPESLLNLLSIDPLASYFSLALLLSCLALVIIAYSDDWQQSGHGDEWYVLLLLSALGGLTLVSASHVASLFLGLELLSIPLYAMMGYRKLDERSLEAALKYLIMASVAAGFLLMGFALIYVATGTLNLADMSQHASTGVSRLGMGLIVVAFGFKLALAPFHFWAPEVYDGVPLKTMIFVATASKVATIAVFIRLFLSAGFVEATPIFHSVLLLASLSAVIAGWSLLFEKRFLRILAYSSTVHMAYWISMAVFAKSNPLPTILFLFGYLPAVFTIGASLLWARALREPVQTLDDFLGLAKRHRILGLAFTIGILSLLGMPLSAGFVIKFVSIEAILSAGFGWCVGFLVLGSILSLVGYFKWVRDMWSTAKNAPIHLPTYVDFRVKGIACLGALLVILFGVLPGLVAGYF